MVKKDTDPNLIVFFCLLVFLTLIVSANLFTPVTSVFVDPLVQERLSGNSILGNVVGMQEDATVDVIIMLKENSGSDKSNIEEQKETVKETQNQVLDDVSEGVEVTTKFETVNAIAATITQEGLEQLEDNPLVESIQYDRPVSIDLESSVPVTTANNLHLLTINNNLLNGSGETVCVIDTGVDYTHPALGGCTESEFLNGTCAKVIGGTDTGNNDSDPLDSNGHGTHVAGTVASTDSTYLGMAPGAKIVAVKVFTGNSGSTTSSKLIAGIDWCKTNKDVYNISVITMSIGDGSEQNSACDSDSLAIAANSAVAAGIFVDASSGNNGYSAGVSSPACASNVTAVGRTDDNDLVSSSSNSGLTLDLLAPGSDITAPIPSSSFGSKSGTSMSAPHVAGAAALVIQYYKLAYNQTLTPAEILTVLSNGEQITDGKNNITTPRIDLLQALLPKLSYTANSVEENISSTKNHTYLEISSDKTLSASLLEWTYPNSTVFNYSMNLTNSTSSNYNITSLTVGNHSYKVYSNNSVNHFSTTPLRTLIINSTEETSNTTSNFLVTLNSPVNETHYTTNLLFNVTATNASLVRFNISDITYNGSQNGTEWTTLLNLSDATYTLQVLANSTTNQTNNTESIEFTVDTTTPLIFNVTSPASINNNDSATFSVNATDLHLSQVLFESNHSGNLTNYTVTNLTYTLTNLSNQKNLSFKFYALDIAGNVNSTSSYSLFVENRVPTINNVTPTNNSMLEIGDSKTFSVNVTDLDGDSLSYLWTFSDGSNSTESSPVKQLNSSGTVIVTVSDVYSSVSSSTTYTVNDTTAPSLTINSYESEIHLESDGNNQSVRATASDFKGIQGINLSYDSTLQTSTCASSTTCTWNWGNLTVGDYSFTVSTQDNSSLVTSSTKSFSVTSCSDSVENGDEDGLDCGGSCSTACSTPDSGSSDSSDSSSSSSSSSGGSGGGSSGSSGSSVSPTNEAEVNELTESSNSEDETKEAESTVALSVDEEVVQAKADSSNSLTGAAIFQNAKSLVVENKFMSGILSLIIFLILGVFIVKNIIMKKFFKLKIKFE